VNFGSAAGGNDVVVGDSFKSSCAVDGIIVGGSGGVGGAMTSFYGDDDTTPTSSSCDVTRSNGMTSSSFGFTQEQVACVCEVRN